jgi:hypothetical protein
MPIRSVHTATTRWLGQGGVLLASATVIFLLLFFWARAAGFGGTILESWQGWIRLLYVIFLWACVGVLLLVSLDLKKLMRELKGLGNSEKNSDH